MKEGDTVKVLTDTEDAVDTLRGTATIEIGRRVYEYRIVHFADGHEGAYEERELMVVGDV